MPAIEFEHDKLGPLATAPPALSTHHRSELRAKLIAEFHSAVNAASDAALRLDEGLAVAVHESRKALRRARAVLAIMAPALPKGERRAVRAALRDARRSLSTIRDHSVAPETLGKLALNDSDRDTARRVLDSAAEAIPPTAEIKQLLGEAAARAAAQAEALHAALAPDITWRDVIRGIRDLYGVARRARRASKVSKAWFHTWRRRTKELTYALDFVARQAGPRTAAIASEFAAIGDLQGPSVDLIMVREFIATHGIGISADALDSLCDAVDAQLDDVTKTARKAGQDAFAIKKRKFARRIAKAMRRDLTPPDELARTARD